MLNEVKIIDTDKYSEFFIKGQINNNNKIIINFINYLFGYDNKIKFKEILDTEFFDNDYEKSDFDRLLPFSSIPKNGTDLRKTFFDRKNNVFQIHSFIEEEPQHIFDLIESFSKLLNDEDKLRCLYYSSEFITPKLLNIEENEIIEYSMENEKNVKEYKKIWKEFLN